MHPACLSVVSLLRGILAGHAAGAEALLQQVGRQASLAKKTTPATRQRCHLAED